MFRANSPPGRLIKDAKNPSTLILQISPAHGAGVFPAFTGASPPFVLNYIGGTWAHLA